MLARASETESQIAERIDRMASREPWALAADVRLQAANAIRDQSSELARRLVDDTVNGASPRQYPSLLPLLIANDQPAAMRLFRSIPFDHPDPAWDGWRMLECVAEMAGAAPVPASAAAQRLPVSKDGSYQRAVGALLHSIDPAGYQGRSDLVTEEITALSARDSMRLVWQLIASASGAPKGSRLDAAVEKKATEIAGRVKELRGDLSDSDRAKLAESLAADIRALPDAQTRLGIASLLVSRATEGDLGHDALQAVTDTLALAIRDCMPNVDGHAFLELAQLVRYEHMKSPIEDPSLESRLELLHLREMDVERAAFTLTGIDGKAYSLRDLRGKVVIVNFWATWCPPCRKEMPDLEELAKRFGDRGLVVLAISDEAADTVKAFIAKQGYTFPVLLDPDRAVNTAFHVEGIPKTFLFGRDGKLAAQSIDMRTREQFLALLKRAGLE